MDSPVVGDSLYSGVQIHAGRVKRDARSSVFAAELVRPPGVKRARQVGELPLPEHVRQPAADRCDVEVGRKAQGSVVRLHALRITMQ